MKRLLIADDDAGMRAALEARFARRGWQVDVAVNGKEALAEISPGAHSLVITDVRMPGCDGFALMREVQNLVGTHGGHSSDRLWLRARRGRSHAQWSLRLPGEAGVFSRNSNWRWSRCCAAPKAKTRMSNL